MFLAQQISTPQIEYPAILPVLFVLSAACVSVLFEAFLPRHMRWPAQVLLSSSGSWTTAAVPSRAARALRRRRF